LRFEGVKDLGRINRITLGREADIRRKESAKYEEVNGDGDRVQYGLVKRK